jgi:glycosyltransferase involved in cell wall biosynthesis
MHQQNNYDVLVILLTDNDTNKIDRSIQSILNQSFDRNRVKIVAVDNHSDDDTYEKLINYAQTDDISVYRVEEKLLLTRLLLLTFSFVEFVDYKYFTILCPGDELYPDYIERCSAILDKFGNLDRKILICETDIKDGSGNISKQPAIFSDNCILKKRDHSQQFLIHGAGHKIQCFYSWGAIMLNYTEFPFLVDFTDWYKKAIISFGSECIYINCTLACTSVTKYNDKLHDLFLRFYLVKKLEMTKIILFSKVSYEYLAELKTNKEIYKKLSCLALQYAAVAIADGELKDVKNILLFAEMVNEEITNTEFYTVLKNSVSSGNLPELYEKFMITDESVSPPDDAIKFDINE